jgi:hypothetical protein
VSTTREAGSGQARRAPFVLLLVGLVVGGLCTLLALNTASAAEQVRRHDLAARNADITAALVELRAEVAASAAPAALANAAARLGMVPNGNPAFLSEARDGRVVVLGSASPASAVPTPAPSPRPTPAAVPAPAHGASPTAARPTAATPVNRPATAQPSPANRPVPAATLPGGPR